MFTKPFDEITKADIDTLIAEGTPEGRELEFKAELPKSGNPKDKGEFAKDVSAFANAVGGYIVYGIAERQDTAGNSTGLYDAVGLPGITKADTEITRLEQMILSNIAPRIYGIRLKAIDGFPQGPVFVLHIPKSWNAPHMVTTDNSRFFSRRNALSMAMDVQEIRSAFVLSAEMPALIRRFRDERLGRIMAEDTPVKLKKGARVVTHVVPFASMAMDTKGIDFDLVDNESPAPPRGRDWDRRFNFDGWVSYSGPEQGAQRSYLQVFRSGALEATVAYDEPPTNIRFYFAPWEIEETTLTALARYLKFHEKHGVEPPVVVAVSLLGFKDATIYPRDPYPSRTRDEDVYIVDRDTLLLPDILVRDFGGALPTLMRPAFDALWQAAGASKSLSYDETGRWSRDEHKRRL